jgi:hypothetical protein
VGWTHLTYSRVLLLPWVTTFINNTSPNTH